MKTGLGVLFEKGRVIIIRWFKNLVKSWLDIKGGLGAGVEIMEPFTLESEIFRNKIWYRGDPSELHQFYNQTDDMAGNTAFWAQRSSNGINFRKIHSGLPSMIVDTLSDIVCSDFVNINVSDAEAKAIWEDIAKENGFKGLLKKAVRTALAEGDGAFRISFAPEVSKNPVIEFFGADRVKFERKLGRFEKVIFITEYPKGREKYYLEEIYEKSGIRYELYDKDYKQTALNSINETANLQDIANMGGFLMAVPLIFDESPRHEGRGRSIFGNKIGALDALDETISQWMDALRDGRAVKYIPTSLLPKNPNTGEILKPNSFDSRYVKTEVDMRENSSSEIRVIQPDIKTDALMASYLNFLDICLQGIISPSTLGIDVKKMDNAEAQREKEKATLYTRNRIIDALRLVLPEVADAAVKTWYGIHNEKAPEYEIRVEFGEYANPSFEAQIETIGKAKQYGIMSAETAVEQLYGDTWTEEEKKKEVEKLLLFF